MSRIYDWALTAYEDKIRALEADLKLAQKRAQQQWDYLLWATTWTPEKWASAQRKYPKVSWETAWETAQRRVRKVGEISRHLKTMKDEARQVYREMQAQERADDLDEVFRGLPEETAPADLALLEREVF